ncbi:HK97 gp10 family phage protein [Rhodococcus tibetensis]|uniref:HK97 gp10 family phage protein n=1 Tax=Rhodococcus tibetensis TaxID=2965064 RepID=A0ABT1QF86_9NOCA|nr:HK97 gp10 family phage protein [Rhodococcus sp. FXJ9.536]MCQ4120405.1 HK97 gp10 family phage protein [Rhodococcus sp. FXJ9.536]
MAALFELVGADQLRRTLRAAGRGMDELKAINRGAADTVAGASRARVPRVSGRLDQSIRAAGTARAGIVRAGKKSVPYAGPIHWGWPARNIRAQPFILNAAEATEPAWTSAYMRHVERLLDQVEGT